MLVINRRSGQSFTVADEIKITIGEIRSGKVKVMIQAPKDIPIVRTEELDVVMTDQSPPRKITDTGPSSNLKT